MNTYYDRYARLAVIVAVVVGVLLLSLFSLFDIDKMTNKDVGMYYYYECDGLLPDGFGINEILSSIEEGYDWK